MTYLEYDPSTDTITTKSYQAGFNTNARVTLDKLVMPETNSGNGLDILDAFLLARKLQVGGEVICHVW